MSESPFLSPADSDSTAERRSCLVARAERAGCGTLDINNSMQELMALASIGRAAREARAEGLSRDGSAKAERDKAPDDAANSLKAVPEATSASRSDLLGSMLQTSGRVVSRKS